MKTTPQPEVKAATSAASRPTRRMRSKGPLQHEGSRPAPRPGGDPLITHLDKDIFQKVRHMVQEDFLNHPDIQCITIQETPQEILEMVLEEEMDLTSLMMACLLNRTRIGEHHESQLATQIQMVITIEMHACTSP